MRLTIIPEDKMVVKDDIGLKCDFTLPNGIHAIQWDGKKGIIEYTDDRPQTKLNRISDIPNYNELMLAYKQAKQSNLPSKYHTWNDENEEFEVTPENQVKQEADQLKKINKLKENVFYGLTQDEAVQLIQSSPSTVKECKVLIENIIKLIVSV